MKTVRCRELCLQQAQRSHQNPQVKQWQQETAAFQEGHYPNHTLPERNAPCGNNVLQLQLLLTCGNYEGGQIPAASSAGMWTRTPLGRAANNGSEL